MSWRQQLLDDANANERFVWDFDAGIGIEFADGCDAFWVLPGELMSTVPLSVADPVKRNSAGGFGARLPEDTGGSHGFG